MILYHGGLIPVPEPDLSLSRQQLILAVVLYHHQFCASGEMVENQKQT